MSHINISRVDRHSYVNGLRERIAILEAQKKHIESLLETATDNLDSLFDRVKSGEEVYLNYEDGSVIWIKAVEPKDRD